jgi:hypothetical protein
MQPDIVMIFINLFVGVSEYQQKRYRINLPHVFKKIPTQISALKSPLCSNIKRTNVTFGTNDSLNKILSKQRNSCDFNELQQV